jgi:hypothetical protein
MSRVVLELLKIIVQPVILERDEQGNVIGERLGEPTALYTPEQISEFVDAIKTELLRANAALDGQPNREQRRARKRVKEGEG